MVCRTQFCVCSGNLHIVSKLAFTETSLLFRIDVRTAVLIIQINLTCCGCICRTDYYPVWGPGSHTVASQSVYNLNPKFCLGV